MNDLQSTVWNKLQQYRIDEAVDGKPPAFPFERRLARENGWTIAYATRVVEEYKKFLYLALFGGHPVCPSDEVDQCWHMHMTFTRSYWDRLCKEVLGMPIHHDPSRGGKSEDSKHDDMYAKTKLAYERAFGAKPPEDIWPSSEKRFDHSKRYRRVDLSAMYLLPRQRVHQAAMIGGGVLLSGTAAGCTRMAGSNGTTAIIIFIGIIAFLAVMSLIFRAARHARGAGCTSSSGCGGGWFFGSDSGTSGDSGGHHNGGHHGGHGHGAHDSGSGHDGGGHGGHGGDSGGSDGSSGDGGASGCGGGGDGGGSGCGGGGCGGGGCGGGGD